MTRVEASEKWQIIKAYGEGKTIEWNDCGTWRECFIFDMDLEELESSAIEYRIKPEEDDEYELPEPFGEKTACEECIDSDREIDCSKCDVQKELEQHHYRPFEDAAELILHYERHFNVEYPSFYEPMMWVKNKENDTRYFITGYGESQVLIGNSWFTMKDLFRQCVFLDGSPVGKLEK